MGRNKILISKIQNDKKRNVNRINITLITHLFIYYYFLKSTFAKRKNGLIKKAMELSILCGCEISLIILNPGKSMNIYCSTDLNTTLKMVNAKLSRNDYLTNADVIKIHILKYYLLLFFICYYYYYLICENNDKKIFFALLFIFLGYFFK